jgi:hypothetical protein
MMYEPDARGAARVARHVDGREVAAPHELRFVLGGVFVTGADASARAVDIDDNAAGRLPTAVALHVMHVVVGVSRCRCSDDRPHEREYGKPAKVHERGRRQQSRADSATSGKRGGRRRPT